MFAERKTAMAPESLVALGVVTLVLLAVALYDKHQRSKGDHDKKKQDQSENHPS